MNKHKEYFNRLAAEWENMIDDTHRACLQGIIDELGISLGAQVLDVGSGTGVLLPILLNAVGPGGKIVALDIADKMLEQARMRYQDPRLHFVVGDAACSGLPLESFDEIICNSCFPHFQDKAAALQELASLLKPGGRLVICHTQGREEINHLHHSIGGLVARDMLPTALDMVQMLSGAGLIGISISDAERYLLSCYKAISNSKADITGLSILPTTSGHAAAISMDKAPLAEDKRLNNLSGNIQEALIIYQSLVAGIFESLGEQSKSAFDLAREGGQDPDRLLLLLDALAALNLLEKEGYLYRNSPLAQNYLYSQSPYFMGDLLELQLAPQRRLTWDNLGQWLKGETIVPNRFDDPEKAFNPAFIRAMAQSALNRNGFSQCIRIISTHHCFADSRRLLDLGGGHGLYAIALKQLQPELKIRVFDFPHVETVARTYAEQYGVKLDFVGGNFHYDDIPGNQDIILAFDMLYPARHLAYLVLFKTFMALKPGGYLFFRHWMLNPARIYPRRAALFALQSRLGNPNAHVPTENEARAMLTGLGFTIEAAHYINDSDSTLLIVKKPVKRYRSG